MPQPVCEGSQVNAGLQSIPQAPRRNRPKAHSMQVRNLYKDYFSSEEGAVPWQYSIIQGERQMYIRIKTKLSKYSILLYILKVNNGANNKVVVFSYVSVLNMSHLKQQITVN